MILCCALLLIFLLPMLHTLQRCGRWYRQRQQQRLHQPSLQLRVSRVRRQQQYLQLTLVSRDGQALPPARAGQHIQLFGTDQAGNTISRAYSLAQDCRHSRFYRLVIKAEPRGQLSRTLFDQIKTGDVLTTSQPKGHFVLRRSRKPLVLIAAGVGITPMLAMALQALRQRRAVTLVYQARTRADLLFQRWLRRLPRLRFIPVLSQAGTDWSGERGRLDAARLLQLCGHQADYYCCAGAAMTAQLSQDLAKVGKTLRAELFAAAASQQNLSIRYRHFETNAAGFSSVLDALNQAGACIPSDCRGGSCGLCKKRLIKGEVIQMLDPAAPLSAGEVLLCCVQAKTALQIGD